MIKFFRRIRQSLFKKNSIGTYMLYAFGEIILVVIGILIALQINNWNERRKDKIAEQKLYETLINSLQNDLDDVNDKMIITLKAIEAQKYFILTSIEDIEIDYKPSEIEKLLLNLSNSSLSFFPNYGMYDKISNNNQLDLIRSSALQMQIVELYEQYYVRHNDLDLTIEQHFMDGLSNNYFYRLEDHAIKNEGYSNIDFETFKRDYHILTIECKKMYGITNSVYGSMFQCKEKIEALITALKSQLKNNY